MLIVTANFRSDRAIVLVIKRGGGEFSQRRRQDGVLSSRRAVSEVEDCSKSKTGARKDSCS